jgi:hypothetical protein
MNECLLPTGARMIALPGHHDARGRLDAFDRDTLPFTPVRTFVISEVPPDAPRAGHAVSCDEFLWVPAGACRLTLSDAARSATVLLDSRQHGVYVPAGIMMDLTDFAPQTLLIVMASKSFSETERFIGPRPDLTG